MAGVNSLSLDDAQAVISREEIDPDGRNHQNPAMPELRIEGGRREERGKGVGARSNGSNSNENKSNDSKN